MWSVPVAVAVPGLGQGQAGLFSCVGPSLALRLQNGYSCGVADYDILFTSSTVHQADL